MKAYSYDYEDELDIDETIDEYSDEEAEAHNENLRDTMANLGFRYNDFF